jgi:hypothetical protein
MKILLSTLMIFSLTEICAQSVRTGTTYNAVLFPQGFGIEQLNSEGTSAVLNNAANINAMNPAAISSFEKPSIGFTYQFQTKIPDAFSFGAGLSRAYNYIPQSVGGIYQMGQLYFGLGFGQRYNGSTIWGPILVTTMEQPDGTGEYITYTSSQMLQYYSFISAYNFKNFFNENSELSVGIKFSLNRFSLHDELQSFSSEGTFLGWNFEAGIRYNYMFSDEQNLSLGICYTPRQEMTDQLSYNNGETFVTNQDTVRSPTFYSFQGISTTVKFPAQMNFDLIYQHSSAFKIAGSLKYISWSDINSNINNQPEYSMSFIFSPNNSFTASAGFNYSDYTYKIDIYNVTNQMDALYLTAGTSFSIGFIDIDIALADSHLFSGTNRKQTIGKIGFGYSF